MAGDYQQRTWYPLHMSKSSKRHFAEKPRNALTLHPNRGPVSLPSVTLTREQPAKRLAARAQTALAHELKQRHGTKALSLPVLRLQPPPLLQNPPHPAPSAPPPGGPPGQEGAIRQMPRGPQRPAACGTTVAAGTTVSAHPSPCPDILALLPLRLLPVPGPRASYAGAPQRTAATRKIFAPVGQVGSRQTLSTPRETPDVRRRATVWPKSDSVKSSVR
jgi:hypothetical protein